METGYCADYFVRSNEGRNLHEIPVASLFLKAIIGSMAQGVVPSEDETKEIVLGCYLLGLCRRDFCDVREGLDVGAKECRSHASIHNEIKRTTQNLLRILGVTLACSTIQARRCLATVRIRYRDELSSITAHDAHSQME